MSANEVSLEQRAAELRRIVEEPSAKERAAAELAEVERELLAVREERAREVAQERLVGVRRAFGSVASSLEADEKRVREAVSALTDAITKINHRYHQLMLLKAEAAALGDRFGITAPALPNVMPPAFRGIDTSPSVVLAGHSHSRPKAERCEHDLRERRSYTEIKGTEGYRIIETAGLKPWPELTERQQHVVEQRRREEEEARRQLARMASEIQSAHAALAVVPGACGVTSL